MSEKSDLQDRARALGIEFEDKTTIAQLGDLIAEAEKANASASGDGGGSDGGDTPSADAPKASKSAGKSKASAPERVSVRDVYLTDPDSGGRRCYPAGTPESEFPEGSVTNPAVFTRDTRVDLNDRADDGLDLLSGDDLRAIANALGVDVPASADEGVLRASIRHVRAAETNQALALTVAGG